VWPFDDHTFGIAFEAVNKIMSTVKRCEAFAAFAVAT
jgi:hypothetical protein